MERLKKILYSLLFPPTPLLMIAAPASAVLLIYALADPKASAHVQYISYFASAYALTAVCARTPQLIAIMKSAKERNRYVNRYLSDVRWRIRLSLHISLIMNGLYAALQLISGFYYHSSWFYSLSGYYAMLAVMRWVLLRYVNSSTPGSDRLAEYRRYRFCGVTMLVMNQALVAIVTFIVFQNRGFTHNSIIVITMAVYTFASISMAIRNLIKFRRYDSPVLSAAKVLSFTSALVSLLSLETAMIAAFGQDNSALFRRVITASTGFAVCALELAMAIIMIIRSTREMKKLKGALQ